MSTPTAAMALRESFGDRKLPDISRKITACVSCRKLKIKCHMNDSKPPCTRCTARGLSCTINKSLQMLLENDASWKETMERRIEDLEQALLHGSNQTTGSSSANLDSLRTRPQKPKSPAKTRRFESGAMHQATENHSKVTLDLSCSLGAFPASSMVNVKLADERNSVDYKPDLIFRGLISLDAAQGYFAFYKEHLDPCIHHILAENDSLASVRARSSILTAAICTVATFCTSSKDYQSCFNAFRDEVSDKLFSDKYEFDDVRALCIGAFWLNDISATLNGLAVRIATQLDLHRCITKMPHRKGACYDRTRLYFLVFLCDHHNSLIYGRPPMTREMRSLKSPGAFLQSEFSNRTDLNLIGQVELWSISRRVFDIFGADIESSIVNQRSADLGHLSTAYDRWSQDWLDVLPLKDETNSFSRRVFDLYFHSAKLYLYSHAFRGPPSQGTPNSNARSNETASWAQHALESALSIIRCIVDENVAHSWLEKLPSYFGTMVAFASVCLIRTSLPGQHISNATTDDTLDYLRRLVAVLRLSSMADNPTHPLLSIATSIETATSERRRSSHEPFDGIMDENLPSFNFDLFTNDALNLTFSGEKDVWMPWPEESSLQFHDPEQF